MVLVQKWPFFRLFFRGNIGQENFFYDVLGQKNAFLGCKNQKFKKSKNWHSFKGVNPWLWPGKCGLRYSRTKKRQIRSSKSRKIDIFPKGLTHGFGAKIAIFRNFFLGNIGQENVFYGILERRNAFLVSKNKKFKKSKNWHFSTGVNPWF